MVSVLASSAIDRGFEPDRVKSETIKLVCVASPLSTQKGQWMVGSESGERVRVWRHVYPRTVVSITICCDIFPLQLLIAP